MRDYDLARMRDAFDVANDARNHGNHPFGAILVSPEGEVLLRAENTVMTDRDATGHAETNLIRKASAAYPPEYLATCTLYSSTEPCAMCATAIHWALIGRLVYGLNAKTLSDKFGPSPFTLDLTCRDVFARSTRTMEVIGPVLEDEAWLVHKGFWFPEA